MASAVTSETLRGPAADARTAVPLEAVPTPKPDRRPLVALAAVFVLAAVYHALQSRAHLSPAIFTDELLFSKLAQSLAAGEGLLVRGEPVFFPALLPAVAQVPAWLVGDLPTGYAVAKALNAVLMSSAAFPAYWLARQLARPSYAVLVAVATVASPAMIYHGYLLSEALAYPVFLLATAVLVRALARPSLPSDGAVVAVSAVAVATRVQFVVLPLAWVLIAVLRDRRRHPLAFAAFGLAGVGALLTGGAVAGPYVGAVLLDYDPAAHLKWSGLTATLVPFTAGWLVLPGALAGAALLLVRPRTAAERAFGAFVPLVTALFLVQIGAIAALDAGRALERYAIYVVPLLFVAFFAYAERGAPRRRIYATLSIALGLVAWLVPFPALADFAFSFDSPSLSAYAMVAIWLTHADAATIYAGVPLAGGLVLAAAPLTRHASRIASATIALLVLTGAAAYAADHAMTARTLRAWAGSPPGWLDRSGLGPADYLALPASSPHFGWMFEAWNRASRRMIQLGGETPFNDSFARSRALVAGNGVLLVDGHPFEGGRLVVNDWSARIELEGDVLMRPRGGLTLYDVPPAPRVRSLAVGLFFDGWSSGTVRYQVWPEHPEEEAVYRIVIDVPADFGTRDVELEVTGGASRRLRVGPGRTAVVELPAATASRVHVLTLKTAGASFVGGGTPNPRIVALRLRALEYVRIGDGRGSEPIV